MLIINHHIYDDYVVNFLDAMKYVDRAVSIQINQYYLEVLFIQYEYT